MDKSSKYIKMCVQANEIQAIWKQKHGDFFVGENGKIDCWISGRIQKRKIRRGFGVKVAKNIIFLSRYVWLPRQDQLMEIAPRYGKRFESITWDFFRWVNDPYTAIGSQPSDLFSSMEQLWLGYVMQRRYAKQWDGEKWVDATGYFD